jgi:hypothetical protein
MSYEDAADNAFGIQNAVNSLQMPPWPPDPNFTHFRDEKVLSASDLEAINLWIDGGMPPGDLNYAPLPPVYNGLSVMQQIDDTVHMPTYTVTLPEDDFRTFVVSSDYTDVKYLNQIEVIPGDYSMVHHLFIWQDPSDSSFVNDTLAPGPGFPSGSTGVYSPYAQLIGGWTPGSELFSLPSNMGMTVSPGADYVVAFHYAP